MDRVDDVADIDTDTDDIDADQVVRPRRGRQASVLRAICGTCSCSVAVRPNGTLRVHGYGGGGRHGSRTSNRCVGSGSIAIDPSAALVDRPDGFELWRGPSAIDGAPIGVVVNNLRTDPLNRKLGRISQVWIMPLDIQPMHATRSGADVSVCGDCRFRPTLGGGCYVSVPHTAQRVWWAWRRNGSYLPGMTDAQLAELGSRPCRIGAWGDPGAVPIDVWLDLLPLLGRGWTAYTERWRTLPADPWAVWCMASCKTPDERAEARALGWRTFRVRPPGAPVLAGERICPASDESPTQWKATCAGCRLCDGDCRTKRPDVAIAVHGRSSVKAARQVAGGI